MKIENVIYIIGILLIVVCIIMMIKMTIEITKQKNELMEKGKEFDCPENFYEAQCCIDCEMSGYYYNRYQSEGGFAQDICLCSDDGKIFNIWS